MKKLIVFPSQERTSNERTPVLPENVSSNIEAMIPFAFLDEMKSEILNIDSDTRKDLQRPAKSNVESTEHILDTWRDQSVSVKNISPLADLVLLSDSGLIKRRVFTLLFFSNKRAAVGTAQNPTTTSVECGT